VTGIEEQHVRAALCVLATGLALVGRAMADAPVAADPNAAPVDAPRTAPVFAPDAGPAGHRDRLMELVVEYFDFAFVRGSTANHTAQLERAAVPAAVVQ
jgi:hypothetical protein